MKNIRNLTIAQNPTFGEKFTFLRNLNLLLFLFYLFFKIFIYKLFLYY